MRLIIRNLTKSISNEMILNKASYSFEAGKIYGICAKEASHLAVLLRCISGEERFDRGYIRIRNGASEHKIGYNDVCLLYENSPFIEMMTGREFVRYYMELHKCEYRGADELMDLIGFPSKERDCLIRDYSGALLKRLQILCMYIWGPAIILMEEPFETVRGSEADDLKKPVKELAKNHIIIISSSDSDKIKSFCDEVLFLNDGVLCGLEENND